MNEDLLNKYLRGIKFIVIADEKTRVPFDIFFGFNLPDMHSDIFDAAKKHYQQGDKRICVQGGGRITKKDNYIIFHGSSQKYKRYEDEVVLKLAPQHSFFENKNFTFLSKAGEDNVEKIIEKFIEKTA